MLKSGSYALTGIAFAVATLMLTFGRGQPHLQSQPPKAMDDRAADRKAVEESSRAFSLAVQKGDAKEAASHWTEQGEYSDDHGVRLRGREAIEKAFAEYFKKRKTKVDVQVESIRFPSKDTAIEEGILIQGGDGPELPTSTFYQVWHVREGGQWRIVSSREWGSGQDRLEDLAWLVGSWKSTIKDKEMSLTFSWDKAKPFITGHFTTKVGDKTVASGNLKIGFDAGKGLLRSWHFDDNGGHGQALWIRDGNRWVMDSRGMTTDGAPTASLNVLTRLNANTINWRSIDRIVDGEAMPDTVPIKLNRVTTSK